MNAWIDEAGARQRALMLLDWAGARDARARQTEQEASRPSAPAKLADPWWSASWLADSQGLLPPEPDVPELTIEDYDDEEEELEAEPVAPSMPAEPADAGDIGERLKALNLKQLLQVAEAFSESGDDEASLRRNLTEYVEHWRMTRLGDARQRRSSRRRSTVPSRLRRRRKASRRVTNEPMWHWRESGAASHDIA